jgi:diketogulonate reductase-like aldo/keto reductase
MASAASDRAPRKRLSDGVEMPELGLGTWPLDDRQVFAAVSSALGLGYRLIDTAAQYGNEVGVGRAIASSEAPREEVFVTTKLRGSEHGYEQALAGFEESRGRLGLDYVDLFLIHWPIPSRDLYVETWKAFVHLHDEGLVRSIGVSNFTAAQIERLVAETGVWPVLNQVELNPYFSQPQLRAWHEQHGITTEAWSPLGKGGDLDDAVIGRLARAHERSAAQIVLRWHVQLGNVTVPKSSHRERMASNIEIFDFALADDEMSALAALDNGARLGGDPDVEIQL